MTRARVLIGLVAIVLAGGWALGDDPKPTTRARGTLPQNWNKLGLTDEQKQKVYEVQGEYRAKIDALQAQIRQLQRQERGELEKVLTDTQKTRLREIVASKVLSEPSSKEEKKEIKESSSRDEKKGTKSTAPDKQ